MNSLNHAKFSLMSRPARARGLKQDQRIRDILAILSRPARARGLKRMASRQGFHRFLSRAPHGRVD